MSCQRNKSMLNDANKNDHECVFYIICLEQNFYIDVLLRNMPTHNILNEIILGILYLVFILACRRGLHILQ